jgi:hypothetical protein
MLVKWTGRDQRQTHLLFPTLQLFDKEVVSLRNLAKLRIHATLQIDEVLPGFKGIPGVLIALSNNLIQMSHRDLSHERFLDSSTENGFHAGVPSL